MRRALLLVLLLPLASASGSVVATSADGQDATLEVESGMIRVGAGLASLQLDGRIDVAIHDDTFTGLRDPPVGPRLPPEQLHDPADVHRPSTGAATATLNETAADAVLLVMPINGQARLQTASWTVEPNPRGERLEHSHAFSPSSGSPYYYEYAAPAGLNVTTHDASVQLTGAFDVYLWGVTVQLVDAAGAHTVRTGTWTEPHTAATAVDHYAYAVLHVEGELRLAGARVEAYAPEVLVDGAVQLDEAHGVLRAGGERYELAGDARLVGQQRLSLEADHLHIDVTRLASVQGPGATLVERPSWTGVGWLGIGFLAVAVGLRLAMRWNWLGASVEWEQRAEAAHAARRWTRARLLARVAVWLDPRSGHARFVHAGTLVDVGRWRQAGRQYEAAYRLLQDARNRALAAYEASRGRAHDYDAAGAADWLEKALELNPELRGQAAAEADFLTVRDRPEFVGRLGRLIG